jgi:Rrf2 family protein
MAELVRMSEATAIGLHAMIVLARAGQPLSAAAAAKNLEASIAHLSKVLQTLVRSGLLEARRGPNGGYALAKRRDEIRLLDIYEALEGPMRHDGCLFAKPVCRRTTCALGEVVVGVRNQVFEHLRSTTLEDVIAGERRQDVLLSV